MRILILIVATLIAQLSWADTSPCSGIDRNISKKESAEYSQHIPLQLKKELDNVKDVSIIDSFRFQNWQILYVNTKVSDEVYLFYPGNPLKNDYVTSWSGAARHDEESQIEKWVTSHAKGIPKKLSKCFSWHVTNDDK